MNKMPGPPGGMSGPQNQGTMQPPVGGGMPMAPP